jgi:hypothetical protein
MAIQAAVVRVMKARRECSFAHIHAEVTLMLANQFVPSMDFLQENVDILIEKDYIRLACHHSSETMTSCANPSRTHERHSTASGHHAASTVYIYVA